MLTVKNISSNYKLEIICNRINTIFTSNQDFWKEILSHERLFYLGNVNGAMLHKFYHESSLVVQVNTFKSKSPWSKSNGYTTPDYPNRMFLNTRKFNRSEAAIGSTIGHETVHNIDASKPEYSFGHGDNKYTSDKDACAPQWFSDVLYKHLSGGIVSKNLDHAEKFIV
jgi:hypothetical protein